MVSLTYISHSNDFDTTQVTHTGVSLPSPEFKVKTKIVIFTKSADDMQAG